MAGRLDAVHGDERREQPVAPGTDLRDERRIARRRGARTPSPSRPRRRRSRCPRAGSAPATRRAAGPGCACPAGSTARPMPLGPSALWAASATRSAPSASTSRSSHGPPGRRRRGAARPDARAPRPRPRRSGWIVPTSLLASITDTTVVRSVIARSMSAGSTRPYRSTGTSTTSKPNFCEVVERVADGVVLDRRRDDAVAAGLAGPRGALEREVARLGPAAREHDLARRRRRSSGPGARGRRRGPRGRAGRTRAPTTGCRTSRRGTAASPRGPRGGAGVVAAWSR